MNKILSLIIILTILTLGAYTWLRIESAPYGEGGRIYIAKGEGVSAIGQKLAEAKIIRRPWLFKALVLLKGAESSLQSGEYEFKAKVSLEEVVEKIRKGESLKHKLTIPEGYSFEQISILLSKTGMAPLETIRATFKDPNYLQELGFEAVSLEGYLFPSTYFYSRETKLKRMLKRMIRSFKKNLSSEDLKRAQELNLSIPQWVALASIIEKETGKPEERATISSVFHNRLKKGMKLQSDPTIIYGLKDFDGDIKRKDIHNPHPYNTYVHTGLPPGPIASPGKESLKAALYPTDTDYLFFVSKGDGSHHFSATLAEHNVAVRKYQLGQ